MYVVTVRVQVTVCDAVFSRRVHVIFAPNAQGQGGGTHLHATHLYCTGQKGGLFQHFRDRAGEKKKKGKENVIKSPSNRRTKLLPQSWSQIECRCCIDISYVLLYLRPHLLVGMVCSGTCSEPHQMLPSGGEMHRNERYDQKGTIGMQEATRNTTRGG